MNQCAFLIFLYFMGLLYTNVLFPYLNNRDRRLLSPFLGIGFSGVAVGLLLIVGIPISLPSFSICLLLILYFARVLIKKLSLDALSWSQSFNKILSDVFSVPFVFYAVLSCFFSLTVFADALPDSTQFEGTGRYLAQGGLVNPNAPDMSFMLNGRLLIVGAMHALNRLFHGYSLYALNPTMCVWLLFFLAYTIFMLNKTVDKVTRIFLVFSFAITLGLYKHFFNGMFDIHSNQLAMIFFTLAIVSLYLFAVSVEKSWVYVGSLAIGFACLTRVDMLMCSLIFFFLLTFIHKTNYKTIIYAWSIFLVLLLPWSMFTLNYTPWGVWYVGPDKLYFLIGVNITLCLFSVMIHKYNIMHFTLFKRSPFILGLIIILFLIFFIPEKIQLSWNLFIKYILLGHSTWLFFVISLAVSTISLYYVGHRDENYYVLFSPTVLYLFMLFLLVAFGGYEMEDHSAKRMVFHTVPLFIYSLFIGFSEIITHKPKPSSRMFTS